MLRFFKNIIFFICLIISLRVFLFLIFYYIEMKINKDINGHSDIAIIGDSHSMTSLDDKMLSDRFSKYVKNYGVGAINVLEYDWI